MRVREFRNSTHRQGGFWKLITSMRHGPDNTCTESTQCLPYKNSLVENKLFTYDAPTKKNPTLTPPPPPPTNKLIKRITKTAWTHLLTDTFNSNRTRRASNRCLQTAITHNISPITKEEKIQNTSTSPLPLSTKNTATNNKPCERAANAHPRRHTSRPSQQSTQHRRCYVRQTRNNAPGSGFLAYYGPSWVPLKLRVTRIHLNPPSALTVQISPLAWRGPRQVEWGSQT